MKDISHIYQDQAGHWVIQSNEVHTAGVAKLSSQFAAEFGMGAWGKVLGQFHDKGKETNAFQQHIKKYKGAVRYMNNDEIAKCGLLIKALNSNARFRP